MIPLDLAVGLGMIRGCEGYQALTQIKKQAGGHTVPIIAFTAKAMANDAEELLHFGFSDYIPKPLDSDQLIEVINTQLAQTTHYKSSPST